MNQLTHSNESTYWCDGVTQWRGLKKHKNDIVFVRLCCVVGWPSGHVTAVGESTFTTQALVMPPRRWQNRALLTKQKLTQQKLTQQNWLRVQRSKFMAINCLLTTINDRSKYVACGRGPDANEAVNHPKPDFLLVGLRSTIFYILP